VLFRSSLTLEKEEDLTLWRATEIFLKDPEIRESRTKSRYLQCLHHIIEYFGKEALLNSLWLPEFKQYRITKQREGLSNGTVNWQMTTLSKMFTILEQHRLVQQNPIRLLKKLSTKESQRHVYLSWQDVSRIVEEAPDWFGSIIWTSYYSGMRKGEILGLTWDCIDLKQRIIFLGVEKTKERAKKKVPIHLNLMSILRGLKVRGIGNHDVFTIAGNPLGKDSTKRAWDRTVKRLGFETKPNFHDLRHTFKTNCRRSKIDAEIRERILGHSSKELGVRDRYGVVSNQELVEEIDKLSFDHGQTEIWVEKKSACTKRVQKASKKEGPRYASKP
jgi:integrase